MMKKFDSLLTSLRHRLIVSCQAEDGFPLNTPHHLAALAETAVIGGAGAIRASEPENIRAIKAAVDVPVIGIYKKDYPGFEVRITPTLAEVEQIVAAGSDIIALDATHRPRPDGQSLADLFQAIRARFDWPLMADISTLEEGITAANLGADIVATTLSGYTAYSKQQSGPNLQLIQDLAAAIDVPIIAEGRISSPDDVRAALLAGAHAVVVGSMITRPHLITEHFRAGTRLQPAAPVIAVDIGGTKIAGGIAAPVTDPEANIHLFNEDKVATPTTSSRAVVGQVVSLIEGLMQRYDGPPPAAIGVSTGGQVDSDGRIASATDTIPGWAGTDPQASLSTHFGLPTAVLNDGHAAALAEARYGAGRGKPSVLCITIGTGLGGGLVIDGRLQPGQSGLAGSIGHIKVSPGGRRCSCGQQGCLEAYVSGPALQKAYNEMVPSEQALSSGQAVAEHALKGDEMALKAVTEMADLLGLGLAAGLATIDPSLVVIGGSVAQLGELLFDHLRRSLKTYGFSSTADTPIVPARFGPQASLIGAAAFAWQQINP